MLKVRRGQGRDSTTADSSGHTQHTGQNCTWHWCHRYTHWIATPCNNQCCRCINHRYKPRNRCCCHKRCCRPCPAPYVPYNPYPYYPPYTTYGPVWVGSPNGTAVDYMDNTWSTSDTSGLINLKNTQWNI